MVRVDVYKGDGTYIGILIDWTENDGYAEPSYPLDNTLLPGAYYIEIIDDLGRWGIGGDFSIGDAPYWCAPPRKRPPPGSSPGFSRAAAEG
jgi:hypothetical protein